MDERRQLPRWKIKKEAKVWMPQTQAFTQCIVEDMHLKGMCVSFNKMIPKEDPLRMSFSMGEDFKFIKIEAHVPWTMLDEGRFVYGLSFSKIAEDDKSRIGQYINETCKDQFNDRWWGV